MKTAKDYPITEGFGCQPGYPLNQGQCPKGYGFHNGIDYGCPNGTPIVVNGITIGLSGSTGYVTGPHLHIGRWVNGKVTNPGIGKGFTFKSAKVTEINEDAVNGKYVRVQADGASWIYLHMSNNTKVKVGQVLKGEEMPTKKDIDNVFVMAQNKHPSKAQLSYWSKRSYSELITAVKDSKIARANRTKLNSLNK